MRNLTLVFGLAVFGVVFSFGMGVYTSIRESRAKAEAESSLAIPPPATTR